MSRRTIRFGPGNRSSLQSGNQPRPVIRENPLARAADQPSRFLVAFVANPAMLEKTRPMVATSWGREAFALGSDAAYLWCPDGSIESKVLKEFSRLTGAGATTRNWATVLRLQAALQAS